MPDAFQFQLVPVLTACARSLSLSPFVHPVSVFPTPFPFLLFTLGHHLFPLSLILSLDGIQMSLALQPQAMSRVKFPWLSILRTMMSQGILFSHDPQVIACPVPHSKCRRLPVCVCDTPGGRPQVIAAALRTVLSPGHISPSFLLKSNSTEMFIS